MIRCTTAFCLSMTLLLGVENFVTGEPEPKAWSMTWFQTFGFGGLLTWIVVKRFPQMDQERREEREKFELEERKFRDQQEMRHREEREQAEERFRLVLEQTRDEFLKTILELRRDIYEE